MNEHDVMNMMSYEKGIMPHRKNVLTSCILMYHVTGLKQTRGIKNVTQKAAKQFVGVMVCWYFYDLHCTNEPEVLFM